MFSQGVEPTALVSRAPCLVSAKRFRMAFQASSHVLNFELLPAQKTICCI